MSEKNVYIKTPEAILCFPSLFTPKKYEGSEKEKYEALLVFPEGSDTGALRGEEQRVVKVAFQNGARGVRSPFRDGNEVAEQWGEVFRNATFIRATSQFKPAVVDAGKNPVTDEERVYSGCIVRAVVHAFTYDNRGNRGVTFGLDAVQIVRDGKRIGGSGAAVAMFDDLSGESAPETLFD